MSTTDRDREALLREASELLARAQARIEAARTEQPTTAASVLVYKPLYEALLTLYNAVMGSPVAGSLRNDHPGIDYALMRTYYEMARSNGQELPPFDEYLLDKTDFWQRHQHQKGWQHPGAGAPQEVQS